MAPLPHGKHLVWPGGKVRCHNRCHAPSKHMTENMPSREGAVLWLLFGSGVPVSRSLLRSHVRAPIAFTNSSSGSRSALFSGTYNSALQLEQGGLSLLHHSTACSTNPVSTTGTTTVHPTIEVCTRSSVLSSPHRGSQLLVACDWTPTMVPPSRYIDCTFSSSRILTSCVAISGSHL